MGTAYKGSQAEVCALDTYIKLMRAADSLSNALTPTMKEVGLTPSQFGVLEALMHLGPMCQREIGRKLLTSGGNVTMVVDNLEKRTLVRRERGEQDRRYITVHLTPEGRRLIEETFPRHVACMVRRMQVLTLDEQGELGRLCRKLGRHCLAIGSGEGECASGSEPCGD